MAWGCLYLKNQLQELTHFLFDKKQNHVIVLHMIYIVVVQNQIFVSEYYKSETPIMVVNYLNWIT